jgi:hypothetical protein
MVVFVELLVVLVLLVVLLELLLLPQEAPICPCAFEALWGQVVGLVEIPSVLQLQRLLQVLHEVGVGVVQAPATDRDGVLCSIASSQYLVCIPSDYGRVSVHEAIA